MQRHRKLQTSARKVQKHTGRRRQGELSSFETAGGAFTQRLYAQLNINRSETMRRRRSCAFGSPLASVPWHAYKLSVKNSASWVRTHLVAAETNLHAELPKRSKRLSWALQHGADLLKLERPADAYFSVADNLSRRPGRNFDGLGPTVQNESNPGQIISTQPEEMCFKTELGGPQPQVVRRTTLGSKADGCGELHLSPSNFWLSLG